MTKKRQSDLSRAFSEDGAHKTHVGGQALLEGVMMRGKFNWAVAVRKPNGDIYTESRELASARRKARLTNVVLVRGCRALSESLVIGYKALEIAIEHAFPDDELEGATTNTAYNDLGTHKTSADADTGARSMLLSAVLGVFVGIVVFIVVPAAITTLIVGNYSDNALVWNIVDGILRVIVFVFYIWLIGRMSDIKRMFAYHGAEHKTIHCYEHGLPLTPENARNFPRLHVRCGTAFLIMVMVIAILVYTIVPISLVIKAAGIPEGIATVALLVAVRIVFMPIIAGVSYEITVKWAGAHPENPLVRVVLWPGMRMQYLTTREPDDSMLECAIAAMKLVLDREKAEVRRAEQSVA